MKIGKDFFEALQSSKSNQNQKKLFQGAYLKIYFFAAWLSLKIMKVLLVLLILSVGLLAQSDGYLGGPSGDLGKPSGDYGKPGSGVGNPPNSPPPASGGTPAFGSPSHQNPYMNQGGGYGRPGHSGGIQHAPHGHGHGGGRR